MSDGTIIELDDYEVANLRAGLQTLRSLNLDTGDWLGQILNRLPPAETLPNRAVSVQVAQVTRALAVSPADTTEAG